MSEDHGEEQLHSFPRRAYLCLALGMVITVKTGAGSTGSRRGLGPRDLLFNLVHPETGFSGNSASQSIGTRIPPWPHQFQNPLHTSRCRPLRSPASTATIPATPFNSNSGQVSGQQEGKPWIHRQCFLGNCVP